MTRLNPASHGSVHIQRKTVKTENVFLTSTVTGSVIIKTIQGKNKITFDWGNAMGHYQPAARSGKYII